MSTMQVRDFHCNNCGAPLSIPKNSKGNAKRWDDHSQWGKFEEDSKLRDVWVKNFAECCEAIKVRDASNNRGTLPMFAQRMLEKLKKPQTDWRTILNDFIQEEICDYSFSPPDRRFQDSPFFLPDFNEMGKNDNVSDMYSDSFLPEIDRIYAGKMIKAPIGHPVHYFLRTRLNETREGLSRSLISALYDNGRIFNKRYTYVDFYENDSFNDSALEALYRSCGGGAIIIRYHSDDESNDRFARNNRNNIERICETAKTFCQSVLTVFWTNLDSVKTRDSFLANLTSVPIVEITEDMANAERAEIYLSERAKDNKIDADDKLFNNIKDGKSFHITELNRWFDEWYTEKLHTVVYAQYKDVKTVKAEIVKAAPKGNAAVELHEMIGLDNAKEVIENAVSFFKMQKLYAEKGIKADRPSMHMVFTGNPGTAKTTVARLFAQIMKDNGLLTKGDLYEVGRADIVGQFVGQTAPLVKKHFNMAKGSVLFIDEAYSLVDDRNGLYGDEAINTIVQEMENNRSDLVVIFAGYPDKMEEFLNKNPGLRSRIAFHVNFDDYSTDELIDIADLMIKKTGFKFTGEAHKKLGEVFDTARKKQDFGNGRYVRNLIELSSLKQASRLAKSDIDHLTDDEMRTITVADIAAPLLSQDDGKMAAIGF